MAKKRQKLDFFFRQNLSDYELSQGEGNWDLLNHLLSEREGRRRKRKIFFLLFSLMLLISAGLIMFLINEEGTTLQSGTKTIPPAQETHQNSFINAVEKEEAPVLADIVQHSGEEGSPQNDNIQANLNNKAEKPGSVLLNQNTFKDRRESNSRMKNQVNDFKVPADVSREREHHISTAKTDTAQLEIHSEEKQLANNGEIKMSETIAVATPHNNDSLLPGSANQLQLNQDAAHFDSLAVVSEDLVASFDQDSQLFELANTQEIIPDNDGFKNFNISAGVNIYNTSEVFINQQNVAPLVGLEYVHPVSPKWAIGLSVWYSPQGGYHLHDTAVQETYFFDHIVSQEVIQIDRLHRLYFPLSAYYGISKKHILMLGVQPSYLLNTSGDYFEIKNSSSGNTEAHKKNVKGYMDGIKPVNISVSLGYRYRITKSFDLNVRLNRELTEAYTSEYFYGINTKPSWTFQSLIHFNF